MALSFTILLEAISSIFMPQEVSDPILVGIVGCCGLLSNIMGLALVNEHSHSHGGHQDQSQTKIEEGRAVGVSTRAHVPTHPEVIADGGRRSLKSAISYGASLNGPKVGEEDTTAADSMRPVPITDSSAPVPMRKSTPGRPSSHPRSRPGSAPNIPIYPLFIRNSVIEEASRLSDFNSAEAGESEAVVDEGEGEGIEHLPLLAEHDVCDAQRDVRHADHHHARPNKGKHGGKDHDLNLRGVFLHVMGDALGNLGVIGSALIIYFSVSPWRFYCDPAISLMITVIILTSAIPLCKAASRILLQAVPLGMDLDEIKNDVLDLEGVLSCHHLHVWQLTGTKLVATLHITVDEKWKDTKILAKVRKRLHEYDIHSATIQEESPGVEACRWECIDECNEQGRCCVPTVEGNR